MPDHQLYIIEHLLPLRWIIPHAILVGSGKPPYDARSQGFWDAVHPHTFQEVTDIPLYTTRKDGYFEYEGRRGGMRSFTRISGWNKGLRIRILLKYRGLGIREEVFEIPKSRFGKSEAFEPFLDVGAQGWWPEWAKLIIKMVGWRHTDKVVWPDFRNPDETLRLFVLHRMLDLLGGLAFLCKDGFFCGEVESVCSGHLGDIRAINQIFPTLECCG